MSILIVSQYHYLKYNNYTRFIYLSFGCHLRDQAFRLNITHLFTAIYGGFPVRILSTGLQTIDAVKSVWQYKEYNHYSAYYYYRFTIVLVPAEVTYFNLYPTTITGNQTFAISAKVVGNPDPTYWVVNNDTGRGLMSATLPSEFTLSSIAVRCDDYGTYMVTGFNKLNKQNFSMSHHLTILCKLMYHLICTNTPTPNTSIIMCKTSDFWQYHSHPEVFFFLVNWYRTEWRHF